MLNKNKVFVFIVTMVFAILAIITIWFQSNQGSVVQAQTDAPKLTLELGSSNNNYVLLEPIPISFKLSNQTNTPISLRGILLISQDITFLVRRETGEETRIGPFHEGGMPSYVTMQPGKYFQTQPLLDDTNLEKVFPTPGRYEVRAEFVYDKDLEGQEKERILSNVITLNIKEPQGINRQAYEYIKQTIQPVQFKIHPSELAELRQNFMGSFGNSVYGKYMAVKLARNYRALQQDLKAERELCKVHNLDFFHSKEVKRQLLEINAKLRPMILNPNLPENAALPLIIHPCTGKPVNPHDF